MPLIDQDLARRARQVTSDDHQQGRIDHVNRLREGFNNVFAEWPMEAPAILADESVGDFDRRLVKLAKRQLPRSYEIRNVQVNQLADDAFQALKPQIYEACRQAIHDPATVADGELRMLTVREPDGQKSLKFIGQTWFGALGGAYGYRPGRRVKGFAVRHIDQYGHVIE